MKNCLTIAGSDCSGGAGIQADIKTFSALGCFAMSAITSVVAENTQGVIAIQNLSPKIVAQQIDAVFIDIDVAAVKIGMLPNVEIIKTVAKKLSEYAPKHIVCDPVMVATSGDALNSESTAQALKKYIFPLAEIITPNIPEAEELSGYAIKNIKDFDKAAQKILPFGEKSLLIKGGHSSDKAIDVLYTHNSRTEFAAERIDTKNTHGTGCTLSSAIAAYLAEGLDITQAVKSAKHYITGAITAADELSVGKGCGPTHHFFELYQLAQKTVQNN